MVARSTSQAGGPEALFRWWRGVIGRTLSSLRAPAGHSFPAIGPRAFGRMLARYARSPAAAIAEVEPAAASALTVTGVAAALAGAVVAIALAGHAGTSPASATLGALSPLAWAVARLALFTALASGGGAPKLRAAWAAALLPLGVAWNPVLRVAAFAASAGLTYAGMQGAGIERRRAVLLVALGFGAEAAAAATAWFVGNGLVFLAALPS